MRPPLDAATRPRLVRGLTVGLSIATVVIGLWLVMRARGTPPPPTEPPLADSTPALDRSAPEVTASTEPPLPSSCDALAARAADGGPDGVLLAWLCPRAPLDAVAARAALLAVRSPDEAAALVPRLTPHPALAGLARLAAQDSVRPAAATVPDPARAVVSPVDERVLGQVQRAHTAIATAGLPPGDRTRARAFVAKVYLQATQQLGVSVGRPLDPFTRLLVGRALHYGRRFCLSYWRMRVSGLANLFAEVETRLLALVLTLEGDAHHADAARLVVELDQTREYLRRDGPRRRIERRLAERHGTPWGPERLAPLPNDIERLLDQGLVDLALSRGLARAREPGGPGLRAVEQLLRDALVRAERGEYMQRLERRLGRLHDAGVPAQGPGTIGHAAERPWPSASAIADRASVWIDRASGVDGLARRYAQGRALLHVRPRPDAVAVLLDRATDPVAFPTLHAALPWLMEEWVARDDGERGWLTRRAAVEASQPTAPAHTAALRHAAEASRRRRFAALVRTDDRTPRGPGL